MIKRDKIKIKLGIKRGKVSLLFFSLLEKYNLKFLSMKYSCTLFPVNKKVLWMKLIIG